MDTKALNIPDEVRKEIDAFAAEVERLNRGEVSDDDQCPIELSGGFCRQILTWNPSHNYTSGHPTPLC
jgi:hypothetical protein